MYPSVDFAARLATVAERIDGVMEALLSPQPQPGETARPPRLLGAMRHACLGGGKRLRPFLLVETARMLGRDGNGILRAGAAVELMHCYSLVHDDLPAMDDDDLRRGKPTVHCAFDEATAILAGDALQALAFAVLAEAATDPDPQVRAELVLGLARAAGIGGMAGGQMLDLAAEGRYGSAVLSEAEVRRLQAMKTGAILTFAVEAGAILGRASSPDRERLAAFGRRLGAAFQIADDVLDRNGNAAAAGKRTGKDRDRGKATLVELLGLDGACRECARLVDEATACLSGFGDAAEPLRQAARFVIERRS
jgi:farnesyl diphosphate synthase